MLLLALLVLREWSPPPPLPFPRSMAATPIAVRSPSACEGDSMLAYTSIYTPLARRAAMLWRVHVFGVWRRPPCSYAGSRLPSRKATE